MAELAPRIRCDNCGDTAEQQKDTLTGKHRKPDSWGSIHAVGGGFAGEYGLKARLDFSDLCETCAKIALDSAAGQLKALREEEEVDNG